MRFTTEFELSEREVSSAANHLYYAKKEGQEEMGIMLNRFWENPVNGREHYHRLDLEVFQTKKWGEFKRRLFEALPQHDTTSKNRILDALADLENSMWAGKA